MTWRWVDKRALLPLHDESLAEHGDSAGLRDQGLLDSAHARLLNLVAYGEPDFADLAASYTFGLAKIIRSSMVTNAPHSWAQVFFWR